MIKIAHSTLQVIRRPKIAPMLPGTMNESFGGVRCGLSDPIVALGTVTVTGDARDVLSGWTIGFIQVETAELNKGLYHAELTLRRPFSEERGAAVGIRPPPVMDVVTPQASPWHHAPGTTFQLLAIPSGWGTGLPLHPFAQQQFPAGLKFPYTVHVLLMDAPSETYPLLRKDIATGEFKRLREVEIGMEFVTILAARDPGGQFTFLKAFKWGVYWHDTFIEFGPAYLPLGMPPPLNDPGAPTVHPMFPTPLGGGNRVIVGPVGDPATVLRGQPGMTGNAVAWVMSLPTGQTANSRAFLASTAPGYF